MIARRIAGATNMLGAPKDWNPTHDGICSSLAVRVDGNWVQSAWEPTPEELAILNAGGSVILHVCGGQPPVALTAEPSAE